MKKINLIWRLKLYSAFAMALCLAAATVGIAQTTGLTFLEIGAGGRATGLAEAFAAVANDATATYWNPAGLRQAAGNQLTLAHTEWLQDVRSEFVACVLPKSSGAFGFSLISTSVSGIEIHDTQPSPEPIATFTAHDLCVGLSYAHRLNSQIDLGFTIKYLYEKIYIDETGGIAGDLGVNFRFAALPVQTALVLQNLGAMTKLRNEAPTLPHHLRWGICYSPSRQLLQGNWLIAGDLVSDLDSDWHANLGVEYCPQNFLALRAGYQSGFTTKNFHFGLGVKSGHFLLDYGYVPLKQDLGQGHRFSLSILL